MPGAAVPLDVFAFYLSRHLDWQPGSRRSRSFPRLPQFFEQRFGRPVHLDCQAHGCRGQLAPTQPRTKAKRGKKASPKPKAAKARDGSKKATVIAMLSRKDGATLEAIMKATDWQAHSVRGFISGALIKKAGLKVESFKSNDGERAYAIRN
jgi:Protein of unknown function (DUF3489)